MTWSCCRWRRWRWKCVLHTTRRRVGWKVTHSSPRSAGKKLQARKDGRGVEELSSCKLTMLVNASWAAATRAMRGRCFPFPSHLLRMHAIVCRVPSDPRSPPCVPSVRTSLLSCSISLPVPSTPLFAPLLPRCCHGSSFFLSARLLRRRVLLRSGV